MRRKRERYEKEKKRCEGWSGDKVREGHLRAKKINSKGSVFTHAVYVFDYTRKVNSVRHVMADVV